MKRNLTCFFALSLALLMLAACAVTPTTAYAETGVRASASGTAAETGVRASASDTAAETVSSDYFSDRDLSGEYPGQHAETPAEIRRKLAGFEISERL